MLGDVNFSNLLQHAALHKETSHPDSERPRSSRQFSPKQGNIPTPIQKGRVRLDSFLRSKETSPPRFRKALFVLTVFSGGATLRFVVCLGKTYIPGKEGILNRPNILFQYIQLMEYFIQKFPNRNNHITFIIPEPKIETTKII